MTGCLVSPVLKDGGTAGGPPVGPHPSRCPTSQQGDPHPTGFETHHPLPHTLPCPTPSAAQGEQQNEAQRRERTQLFTHHFNTANSYNRSELYTMTTREKEPRGDGSAKEWTDGV